MTITLNLSGFAQGDSLLLSVSQNAITAGPYGIGSWSGGGNGGTVKITVDRTQLMVAPDSVRFGVDLSKSTFDTPAPIDSEIYDQRLHDLIFLWDMDDPGTWTVPVNVLTEWKNRTVAKGPFVTHMYLAPRPASGGAGTGYNTSVLIIEPSSGKTAAASVEVFVEDPDEVFPRAQTICVNPVGDNDFSGAPAGARQINVNKLQAFYNDIAGISSPEWDDERVAPVTSPTAPPKRWLFKRGCDFRAYLEFYTGEVNRMTFGAYGNPVDSRPTLRVLEYADAPSLNSRFIFKPMPQWGGLAQAELRLVGLNFEGNFDLETEVPPVSRNGADGGVIFTGSRNMDFMVHDCRASKFCGTTMYVGTNATDQKLNVHINDTLITDFGGQYTIFVTGNTHPESTAAMTGSSIVQNPIATHSIMTRAPIRFNSIARTHLRGNDFFHTDTSQPCFKLADGAHRDGLLVNVHSCGLEGGLWPFMIAGNTSSNAGSVQRISVHNVIIDGLVVVAGYSTKEFIYTRATGVTVRNCLFIMPATKLYNNPLSNVVLIDDDWKAPHDETIVGAAPIAVYNNTFRIDRTSAQNNNVVPSFFNDETPQGLNALNEQNNVFHYPNFSTPVTTFAPLSEVALWEARNIGKTDPETFVLDSQYATPAGSVKNSKPLPGSAALGAALNGDVSYMDITLQKRPEPPSMGAWEVD